MGASDLFARQRALAEIGERGQARLLAASFAPSASLGPRARAHAARYAHAAGFGKIEDAFEDRAAPLAVYFRNEAARDVGLGAADVLNQALPYFALPSAAKRPSALPASERPTTDLPPLDVHPLEK